MSHFINIEKQFYFFDQSIIAERLSNNCFCDMGKNDYITNHMGYRHSQKHKWFLKKFDSYGRQNDKVSKNKIRINK